MRLQSIQRRFDRYRIMYMKKVSNNCRQCVRKFKGAGGLYWHMEYVHESKILACGECHYKASYKTSLTVHMQ